MEKKAIFLEYLDERKAEKVSFSTKWDWIRCKSGRSRLNLIHLTSHLDRLY